jgi:hypothetical protein
MCSATKINGVVDVADLSGRDKWGDILLFFTDYLAVGFVVAIEHVNLGLYAEDCISRIVFYATCEFVS